MDEHSEYVQKAQRALLKIENKNKIWGASASQREARLGFCPRQRRGVCVEKVPDCRGFTN